jgi:AcrR family transcriptional regulator
VNNKQNVQDLSGTGLQARIIAAARGRFQQFGFAKTSMQEIAAACDMSAANLYRFYDGKLAIGAAVAAFEQSRLLKICDQAVDAAGPDAEDRLVALFQANIDETRRKMKRTPRRCELSLTVAREKQELRREFLREIEARIMAILTTGDEPDTAEPAAVRLRSKMILMASAPFVLPWMMLNEPFGNPRSMVRPLVRSLVSGVAIKPPAVNARPTPLPSKRPAIYRPKLRRVRPALKSIPVP